MRALLVSILLLSATLAATPLAAANYMPCPMSSGEEPAFIWLVTRITCAVANTAIYAGFETVQCALTGESDICVLP